MKMKNFRKIALLIAACLCLSLFSGCLGKMCDECNTFTSSLKKYDGKELCNKCYKESPAYQALLKTQDAIYALRWEKYERAIEFCNEALEIDPDNEDAKEILEKAKSGMEQKEKLERTVEKLNPELVDLITDFKNTGLTVPESMNIFGDVWVFDDQESLVVEIAAKSKTDKGVWGTVVKYNLTTDEEGNLVFFDWFDDNFVSMEDSTKDILPESGLEMDFDNGSIMYRIDGEAIAMAVNAMYEYDTSAEERKAAEKKNTPKPASTPKPAAVSDVILSDAEAVAVAEDIVRKNLKSPSSAKFCIMSEATVKRLDNGEYCVGGWVEAQNGYGATIRSTYIVTFTPLRERDKFGYKNPSCDIF